VETKVFRTGEHEVLILGTNFILKKTEEGVEISWEGPPAIFWPAESEGWEDDELTIGPEI
jgi:hypothetical protein